MSTEANAPETTAPQQKQIDPGNMGASELEEYEKQLEAGDGKTDTPPNDNPGDNANDQKSDDSATTPPQEQGGSDQQAEGQKEPGETPPKDRLKETQRAYHESRAANKKLQKELDDLKAKTERQNLEAKVGRFQELSPDAEEELKYSDPDKWYEYKQQQATHKDNADKLSNFDQTRAEQQQAAEHRNVAMSNLEFIAEITQTDGWLESALNAKSEDELSAALPDAVKKYIQSPEWQAVQQKAGAIRPEAYNADTLRDAHRLINFDSEVAKARVTGSDAAVNAIQNAAGGGSVLDRATKEHGSGSRSLSNMPTEETANLGMNDLKAIEDQLRAEGINPEDL